MPTPELSALIALAHHIAAMENDAYLVGHPEWNAIADEANAALAMVQS